jgi:hypothetical protein
MLRKKQFETCARKLCLNSPEALLDLQAILQTIVTNCLEHPDEKQYFKLKMSNKALRARVLSREGGLEFLKVVGFRCVNTAELGSSPDMVEGLLMLLLEPGADELPDSSHLDKCLRWLQSTVETCIEMYGSHESGSGSSQSSCCAYTIQLRLPTGDTIVGGFMPYDTLRDVKSFAECYFHENRCHVKLTQR